MRVAPPQAPPKIAESEIAQANSSSERLKTYSP